MKLAGHIGHGPNSSYPDLCPDMSCCHGIMTENVLNNRQMNVRIVNCVPGRDGQNSLIPGYLATRAEDFSV